MKWLLFALIFRILIPRTIRHYVVKHLYNQVSKCLYLRFIRLYYKRLSWHVSTHYVSQDWICFALSKFIVIFHWQNCASYLIFLHLFIKFRKKTNISNQFKKLKTSNWPLNTHSHIHTHTHTPTHTYTHKHYSLFWSKAENFAQGDVYILFIHVIFFDIRFQERSISTFKVCLYVILITI